MFSEQDVCDKMGISKATFLNWKREGVVEGNFEDFLSLDEYVDQVKKRLGNKLSSRANRTLANSYVPSHHVHLSSNRTLLLKKLLEDFEQSEISLEQAVIVLIVRQLSTEKLLSDRWFTAPQTRIDRDCAAWVREVNVKEGDFLLVCKCAQKGECSLKQNRPMNVNCLHDCECPLDSDSPLEIPFQNDDFLGAFYQSAQTLSQKSAGGSFYTPEKLLESIKVPVNKTVYDPCCGSGNILLNVITREHDSDKVFASDIDTLALKICEANLVMLFDDPNMKAHIFKRSLIDEKRLDEKEICLSKDAWIITNPPWGAKFSASKKLCLQKEFPVLQTAESFSICLYNSVREMGAGGKLFFFLPKSILNVNAHAGIRKYLLKGDYSLKIRLFGTAFTGVVSEVILLEIEKSDRNETIEIISEKGRYSIPKKICLSPYFIIPAKSTPEDIEMQQKLYAFPHITLKDNCDFALGIVTGNNDKFIFEENDSKKGELVYRGKNIFPYKLSRPHQRIIFAPHLFQQTAPEQFYRERKIMYRFIANHLICAISENGELPLNSANVFIPRIDYPFETIVALFNSSIYEGLYKAKFDSVKILRSHIEQLPLPLFTVEQHRQIKELYGKTLVGGESVQKELDTLLKSYLNL